MANTMINDMADQASCSAACYVVSAASDPSGQPLLIHCSIERMESSGTASKPTGMRGNSASGPEPNGGWPFKDKIKFEFAPSPSTRIGCPSSFLATNSSRVVLRQKAWCGDPPQFLDH